MTQTTLVGLVRAAASQRPERTALALPGDAASYAELVDPGHWPTSATKVDKRVLRGWAVAPAPEVGVR